MTAAQRIALIEAVIAAIIAEAAALTDLDQAIGDGDHGINMRRGFEAVQADLPRHIDKSWPELLRAAGMVLVMKVGGASGPLFGTLFIELGKALPADPKLPDLAPAMEAAIAAVQARGRSEVGQKTMLDVLVPVARGLAAKKSLSDLAQIADAAAAATIPLLAVRGRAAFLGERSIGHMDPGARSVAVIVSAIARFVENQR